MRVEIVGYRSETPSEANDGDYQSALMMLDKAIDELKGATEPPLVYLRDCIARFMMGEDLDKAFNLHKPPPGRRPDRAKLVRDLKMSWEVKCLVKRDGITTTRAIEIIADEWNVSTDVVKKARYPPRRNK